MERAVARSRSVRATALRYANAAESSYRINPIFRPTFVKVCTT